MTKVEDYISNLDGEQHAIASHLHELFVHEFDLIPVIKYRIPFYIKNSRICYLNPLKTGGIECAFMRGNELLIESEILQSKGRIQIKGIELKSVNDITEALFEIIYEAIFLDETKPYSKRRKTN